MTKEWKEISDFCAAADMSGCIVLDSGCAVIHPTHPLGAGAELKGDVVVGLRKIYVVLARFI